MKDFRPFFAVWLAVVLAAPVPALAASHREAPITALDHPADITDWFAFVSYDDPSKVTFLLNVDPLLEPGNGPNYFPFDPDVLYTMKIDNNYDAVEDITFEFRFQTEIRAAGVFTGFVGAGSGITAPSNAPRALNGSSAAGALVIPPAITALDGAGAAGLSLRQTYTVTLVRGTGDAATRTPLGGSQKLYAVPSNAGPRTMPNYTALAKQGIYNLGSGVRVFAGTVDDPFYIDLGAAFDSLNFRASAFPSGTAGVLTPEQDLNDQQNYTADTLAGFNVNTIALEVPISLVTQPGKPVIGTWGATYRPSTTTRLSPEPNQSEGAFRQVQRMGNPLINELIIGTGSKDKWSMSQPKDDSAFANFALDPVLARVLNAIYGIPVPNPPRTDMLLLVQYLPPIAPAGTPSGPVADLLRLNTSIAPTPAASRKRMAVLAGDLGGFPNGRRVSDDVTDIAARVVAGVLAGSAFNVSPYNAIGDGVNMNDVPYQETFPFVAFAQSGRDRRHSSPGLPTCALGRDPVSGASTTNCPVN